MTKLVCRPRSLTFAYGDLIALRDQLSPGTHLVFHDYDYAIPDGRGVCHHGPWLKPTFDLHKFPDRDSGFAVMKAMLQQFSAMLASLINEHDDLLARVTRARLATWPELPAAPAR